EIGMLEVLPKIQRTVEGMRAALAKGEPFYKGDSEDPDAAGPSLEEARQELESDPPPLQTPVYVIMPPQSASAALDAIDTFKLFSNTRLIGAPSSADSTYMEVRLADLPSGLGKVIVPNKVYVNRPRGNGVYYNPDILHRNLDWSTEAFLKRVQAEVVEKP
ncbi:MAG: peptidase, partial [Planctomycetota bacterium]